MRNKKYDVLRGLATVFVLLIHVTADYACAEADTAVYWTLSALNKLFGIAVPVFVALTVFLSLKSGKRRSPAYLGRKLLPLAALYLIWSAVYLCYNIGVHSAPLPSWGELVSENLLQGKTCYHLYYIVMLLQLYFALFFLSRAPIKKIRPSLWQPAAASVGQMIALLLFIKFIIFKFWFYNTAVLLMFYISPIVYGLILAADTKKAEAIFRRYWWLYVSVIIVAVTQLSLIGVFAPALFGENTVGRTVFETGVRELFIFGGIPLMFNLAEALKNSRALAILGRHSLGVYFAHPLVLFFIKDIWDFTDKGELVLLGGMALSLCAVLIFSFAYSALAEAIRKKRACR